MAYWLFKCNPKAYDYIGAHNNGVLTFYNTPEHFRRIQIGDKVLIWVTINPHCFAVAEILGKPIPSPAPIPDLNFFTDIPDNIALELARTNYRVKINITQAANHNSATLNVIQRIAPTFSVLRGGTVRKLDISQQDYNNIVRLL